jgi:DNA-directed RNA polymerase subunit RPC12/RpoP
MAGIIDTKYVVCECGSKRFFVKETFMVQKRDLAVRNEQVLVSRITGEQNDYFCAVCGVPVDLKKFINSR